MHFVVTTIPFRFQLLVRSTSISRELYFRRSRFISSLFLQRVLQNLGASIKNDFMWSLAVETQHENRVLVWKLANESQSSTTEDDTVGTALQRKSKSLFGTTEPRNSTAEDDIGTTSRGVSQLKTTRLARTVPVSRWPALAKWGCSLW
jgi:hypothetical protein